VVDHDGSGMHGLDERRSDRRSVFIGRDRLTDLREGVREFGVGTGPAQFAITPVFGNGRDSAR
jgi:hypothetical protein